MLVEQCATQPKTAGCLFRLPFKLRQLIWEMVISKPSSRLCPLSYDAGTRTIKQYETRQILGSGVDPLIVYDYPELRYICRDICHETAPLYKTLGWRFNGQGLPTCRRRYNPDVDILYPDLKGFFQFLSESTAILTYHGSVSPLSVAAVQVRNARHIAIDYSLRTSLRHHEYQELERSCPHIEIISKIIPNVSWKAKMQYEWVFSYLDLPMRPCKLDKLPSFPSPEIEGIEAALADYARRYHIKKAYSNAASDSIKFSRQSGGRLPTPQSAMLLQMIGPPTTEEGEKWEEVEVDSAFFASKPNRSVGV